MKEINEACAVLNSTQAATDETVVAIRLSRPAEGCGQFMTPVVRNWCAEGYAVAFRNGRVIASNILKGYMRHKLPVITPCHTVKCAVCGNLELMPDAVWRAKDAARAAGVSVDNMSAQELIRNYTSCVRCGGILTKGFDDEARILAGFATEMKDNMANSNVGKFLPPLAFNLQDASRRTSLEPAWEWLNNALLPQGKCARPAAAESTGQIIMYNPGTWFGTVDSVESTGLFFKPKNTTVQLDAVHGL